MLFTEEIVAYDFGVGWQFGGSVIFVWGVDVASFVAGGGGEHLGEGFDGRE